LHGAPEFEDELKIGDLVLPCAVLEGGRRVISQRGMTQSLGRGITTSGSYYAKKRADIDDAQLPPFLSAGNIKPFVSNELAASLSTPIEYQPLHGGRTAFGIEASSLPEICEVWLKAQDADALRPSQGHIAARAAILMRGLAKVGIVALVDEATGYQVVRNRQELHKILEAYIAKEFLPWTKRFPDEFYQEMFRLRGWSFDPSTGKKPILVGKLTEKVVYKKLPQGVLDELKRKNLRNEKGRRRHKHFQFLTEDIGDPHLEKHLLVSTALMRASRNWREFLRLLERAIPNPGGSQTEMEFMADDDDESE
jgi:hypothetical protein